MKVASFTVHATAQQSARWKQAAEAYGHASVGTWLVEAADAHLDGLKRAGRPLPLSWSWGYFYVRLEDGTEPRVRGWIARPFGLFRGGEAGPSYMGCHKYTLAYLPTRRIIATFRTAAHCRSLASELARAWVRWGGKEPAEDPGPMIERHRREDV